MADIIHSIFRNKKANLSKLILYGFEQKESGYVYDKIFFNGGFKFTIHITKTGDISAEVIDLSFHEPYTLHLAPGAVGGFVGKIRAQYEEMLLDIADQCFEPHVFKSKQAEEVIAYVRKTYGDELKFLWEKFAGNAVWRRQDTKKWYGVLLTVQKRKLGIASDETVEIIDLRISPEELAVLLDNENYFPGYHMNKKHWFTIILNDSVALEEICRRIDSSYLMAVK